MLEILRIDYGKVAEKIVRNLPEWVAMPLLREVLGLTTPFNKSLHASIDTWDETACELSVRVKRNLKNHLGQMHAGAIVTVGEMAAGMVLIRNINTKKYRLILKELGTVYHKQIKSRCRAVSQMETKELTKAKNLLAQKGEAFIRMQTEILRENGELASTVRTYWHLKDWKKVGRPS